MVVATMKEQINEKLGKNLAGTSFNSNDDSDDENSSLNNEPSDDSNDDLDEMEHESGIDGEDEDDDEDEGDDDGNAGWADAFAKVLQQEKPKSKKYLVLSKAKKLAERVEKSHAADKKMTFEISDTSEKIVEKNKAAQPPDNINDEDIKPTNNDLELAIIARKERNNKLQQLRVKPDSMDRERERSFKRIATKGVVQLFNAVRAQQRDLVDQLEKAGPLDHKRDAVLNNINKRQFLDMLMGGKRAKSENIDNAVKDEKDPDSDSSSKPSQWSVLRDDFMTNKKLKHWDEMDDEIDDQQAGHNDSASDSG